MICGDGPARESLQQQVTDLGLTQQVIFTGEIDNDEVANYYRMADVFASTSVSESQGLTYIEALAAGVKVVAQHSPYTDELLDNPNIGQTVATKEQLVAVISEYLLYPKRYNDPEPLQAKLMAISAENFGIQVMDFYHASRKRYLANLTSRAGERI